MRTQWFTFENGAQNGPYSLEALQRRRVEGTLASDALLWRDGLSDWQSISNIEDFHLPDVSGSPSFASATNSRAVPHNSPSDVAWAKAKIVGSWVVTAIAALLYFIIGFQESLGGNHNILAIIAWLACVTPFIAYTAWATYWIAVGAFWPFVKKHWKGLLLFSAVNLPAFGLAGILIMILLLPFFLILIAIVAVVAAVLMTLVVGAIVAYGTLGGGIYHYLQVRRVARMSSAG